MKKQYQLTQAGKDELIKELEELKSRRGTIAEKIANARDYGDLSENAEYDAAREEQGQVETRIGEIEEIILNADIIKAKKSSSIQVGSTVELSSNGDKATYTIVGPVEADPINGKVSDVSPIGKALMGKKVGDKVTIKTPKSEINYKVVGLK